MTVCVVGAAILDGEGRLLAARRLGPVALAGGWELPGGKVEPGEDDESALVRECLEELGVLIEPGERVGGDWAMSGAVLRVWRARILDGEPRPLEDHSELRWLEPGHWLDVAWLAADLPVVRALSTTTTPDPPAESTT